MLNCPVCHIGLDRTTTRQGAFFACQQCSGKLVPVSLLRQAVSPSLVDDLARAARAQIQHSGKECPSCSKSMALVMFANAAPPINLDICTSCEAVWLDRGEFDALPKRLDHAVTPPPIPQPSAPRPATPPKATTKFVPGRPTPPAIPQSPAKPAAAPPAPAKPVAPPARAAPAAPARLVASATNPRPPAAQPPKPLTPPATKPAVPHISKPLMPQTPKPPPTHVPVVTHTTAHVMRAVAEPASSQANPQARPLTNKSVEPSSRSSESQHVANLARLSAEEAGRESRARAKQEQLDREVDISLTPEEPWQWAPGAMGLPVVSGEPTPKALPVLTVLAAAGMSVLFAMLVAHGSLGSTIADWGFVPQEPARHGYLTLLTCFALHASVWHLVGNMYFLVIFGRNVEDNLGRFKFMLMLLLGHLAGTGLHMLCDPRQDLPVVGASAGISAVIAYYGVTFPNARIGIMWRLLVVVGPWIRVPAFGALILFILVQLAGTVMQVYGFSEVSYLGHLGGIAVGLFAAIVARARRNALEFAAPKLA